MYQDMALGPSPRTFAEAKYPRSLRITGCVRPLPCDFWAKMWATIWGLQFFTELERVMATTTCRFIIIHYVYSHMHCIAYEKTQISTSTHRHICVGTSLVHPMTGYFAVNSHCWDDQTSMNFCSLTYCTWTFAGLNCNIFICIHIYLYIHTCVCVFNYIRSYIGHVNWIHL
jgi:hypothetical protein